MEMTPTEPLYLCILVLTGAFTGIISGLLGVGGGFIMSPVQYWLLQETGMQPDLAIRAALGTSLFVILINAIFVTLKYHQKASSSLETGYDYGGLRINCQFRGSSSSFLPACLYTEYNFRGCDHNGSSKNLYHAGCKGKE